MDRAGRVGHRRLAGLRRGHRAGRQHRRSERGGRCRGHQPGHGGSHHPRVLLRSPGRRARRPVGPQAGHDHLRPGSGRGDRVPAVRAQPGRSGGGLARARGAHPVVVAGQGCQRPQPGPAGPPHHRQLAVAGRGLRHLPVRLAAVRPARRRLGVAGLGARHRLPLDQPDGARLLRGRGHVRGGRAVGADAPAGPPTRGGGRASRDRGPPATDPHVRGAGPGLARDLPQPHHPGREHRHGHRAHRRGHVDPARGGLLGRGAGRRSGRLRPVHHRARLRGGHRGRGRVRPAAAPAQGAGVHRGAVPGRCLPVRGGVGVDPGAGGRCSWG